MNISARKLAISLGEILGLVTLKKVGDEIRIGDAKIVIAEIKSKRVKLYMEAPPEMSIQMGEKKEAEGNTEENIKKE
jgi:sRNA-binding carbon storage regulator CsrA